MPRLYDPLLVMVYADEAVQALLKGDLVNVIVNQSNTTTLVHTYRTSWNTCTEPPYNTKFTTCIPDNQG